ncbi:MAG: ABC transporter permease [Fimbriimonadaceae bacterium]|nr:ABC transporter permease [Fimbriimonadaceae bacterium]
MKAAPKNDWFVDLILDNPMLIEIRRFRRKYVSTRGTGFAGFLLFMVAYGLLVTVQLRWPQGMSPGVVLMIELGLFCFLVPTLIHGAIAGERERRSWDFLLVAPVTRAQVVVGKFMGSAWGIVLASGLFLVPLTISLVAESFPSPYGYYGVQRHTSLHDAFLGVLVVVTFALMIAALTLFFSARCKRPLMALGASLGLIAIGLIAFPILVAPMMTRETELIMYFHPFYVLFQLAERWGGPEQFDRAIWGWPQVFVYAGMTIVLLIWTERTLGFAENEVKFVGGRKDA